jgi:hypothetical protein
VPRPNAADGAADKVVLVPVEREEGYRRYRATALSVARVPFEDGEHFEISLQSLCQRELSHRVGVNPQGTLTLMGKNVRLELHEVAGFELTRDQALKLRSDLTRLLDVGGQDQAASLRRTPVPAPNQAVQLALSELREEVGATPLPQLDSSAKADAQQHVPPQQVPISADAVHSSAPPRAAVARPELVSNNEPLVPPRHRGARLVLGLLLVLAGVAFALAQNTHGIRDALLSRIGHRSAVQQGSDATPAAPPPPEARIEPAQSPPPVPPADEKLRDVVQSSPPAAQNPEPPPPPIPVTTPSVQSTEAAGPAPAPNPPTPAVPSPSAATPAPPETLAANAAAAPPEPRPADPPASTPTTAPPPHLALRARSDTWVLVRDPRGETLFGRLLRAGETWAVPRRPGLRLTTGNAAGTEVLIDGNPAPPLGPPGVVRRDIALDDLSAH